MLSNKKDNKFGRQGEIPIMPRSNVWTLTHSQSSFHFSKYLKLHVAYSKENLANYLKGIYISHKPPLNNLLL